MDEIMTRIYARLVVAGRTTIEECPEHLRDAIRAESDKMIADIFG